MRRAKSSERAHYFKHYEAISPTLILGLVILTVGLYLIYWIYSTNKDMEKLIEDSPDSNRGIVVMFVLPIVWFFLTYFMNSIIFNDTPLLIEILEIIVWAFLFFIAYKYIFDFTQSFAGLTHSNYMIWYACFIAGGLGLISLGLGFMYTAPLVFFMVIAASAMQGDLNVTFRSYSARKQGRFHR